MHSQICRRKFLQKSAQAAAFAAPVLGMSPSAWSAKQEQGTGTEFFTEVAPGVFVHQGHHAAEMTGANLGDISNCGVVIGKEAIAVIDTGGSAKFGSKLKAAIRTLSQLPIRHVINTHMHPDHVFGNAPFEEENTSFVAHHKLARGLSARAERYISINSKTLGEDGFAGTRVVLPTQTVTETLKLDLGGRQLTLTAHKTAHTDNDLTIRDSATETVFMGDLIFSGHTPTLDGSIVGWLKRLEDLKAQPTARIVPGHGPAAMPWPQAAQPMERYFSKIAKEIRAILARDGTLTEAMATVGQSEKGAWELFSEYHTRNVSAAFAELEWE